MIMDNKEEQIEQNGVTKMRIGSNKGKIIFVAFLRFIIVSIFLGGIYVSSVNNPNTNNGAFTVMVLLGVAFEASPLRHLNEVLELYPDKIVLKKRKISFSTIEEIKWRYERGYLIGRRLKCCKETENTGLKDFFFPYYEIDVTYIKNPQEEFVKFYTNTIGEQKNV